MGSIIALSAAPAIVRADSLMRIVPVHQGIVALDDYETGWILNGRGMFSRIGNVVYVSLSYPLVARTMHIDEFNAAYPNR